MEYRVADDAAKTGHELIAEHHPHLLGPRVDFVFMDKTPKNKGKDTWGRAKKVSGLGAFLANSEDPRSYGESEGEDGERVKEERGPATAPRLPGPAHAARGSHAPGRDRSCGRLIRPGRAHRGGAGVSQEAQGEAGEDMPGSRPRPKAPQIRRPRPLDRPAPPLPLRHRRPSVVAGWRRKAERGNRDAKGAVELHDLAVRVLAILLYGVDLYVVFPKRMTSREEKQVERRNDEFFVPYRDATAMRTG